MDKVSIARHQACLNYIMAHESDLFDLDHSFNASELARNFRRMALVDDRLAPAAEAAARLSEALRVEDEETNREFSEKRNKQRAAARQSWMAGGARPFYYEILGLLQRSESLSTREVSLIASWYLYTRLLQKREDDPGLRDSEDVEKKRLIGLIEATERRLRVISLSGSEGTSHSEYSESQTSEDNSIPIRADFDDF